MGEGRSLLSITDLNSRDKLWSYDVHVIVQKLVFLWVSMLVSTISIALSLELYELFNCFEYILQVYLFQLVNELFIY